MELKTRARLSFAAESGGEPDLIARCDNLAFAATFPDASFQLLYLDPPFATGAVRRAPSGASFADRFAGPEQYLAFLEPRLAEAHRLLADDGALFLHLDWHASHHARVALDRRFGAEHFVNEIVWCYAVGGKSARAFGRKHDTLLFYGKTDRYVFHADAVRVPRRGGSHMRVTGGEDGEPVQEKTDRKTGRVYRYPVREGKVPEDWWTDIETLNHSDVERAGYPTQKPERLLERVIAAASDPGRLVGDLFLGSGTTAVVARRLGRRFAGVDQSEEAVRVTLERLQRQASSAGQELPLLRTGAPLRDVLVLEDSDPS